MDRRTFMKLLGGLASMPIIGRIAKPLKSETVQEGIAAVGSKGMELYEMVIAKVMKEGKNIVDATVDPMVGLELVYPEAVKRFGGKGLQNALGRVLSLGRVGAMMTPVGLGIGALGLGKMGIEAAMKEREKILGMTEEEKTNYLADQYESFGGVFGEGA